MPTTIAYSNKGGYWKTKYTWMASFMQKLGRKFFTSSIDFTADSDSASYSNSLVWKHNSNDDTNRANFYGNQYGTGLSVSFNDKVSRNKIYKSFSLEGTGNIDNGINTFIVNADNNPNKQFSMGRIKDKGGILYGHIGQSNTLLDGSNIKVMGTVDLDADVSRVDSPGFLGDTTFAAFLLKSKNMPVKKASVTNYSKYVWMINPSVGSPLSRFYSFYLDPIELTSDTTYNDIPGSPLNFRAELKQGALIDSDGDGFGDEAFDAYDPFDIVLAPPENVALPAWNGSLFADIRSDQGSIITLLEVTPQNINGAPPRGQYAQADIALGSEPYELFAINVNYEPTDLDHSK